MRSYFKPLNLRVKYVWQFNEGRKFAIRRPLRNWALRASQGGKTNFLKITSFTLFQRPQFVWKLLTLCNNNNRLWYANFGRKSCCVWWFKVINYLLSKINSKGMLKPLSPLTYCALHMNNPILNHCCIHAVWFSVAYLLENWPYMYLQFLIPARNKYWFARTYWIFKFLMR